MNDWFVPLCYLAAGSLFIVGLRGITQPKTARRGLQAAQLGMLFAIVGTLVDKEIVEYQWIVLAFVIGSAIGTLMSVFVPMTAMPQRIALSHAFGALAAGLVGTAHYYDHQPDLSTFDTTVLMLEVLLGFLTFTGSLMAFGKLHEILPGRPQVYPGQNVVNIATLVAAAVCGGLLIDDPSRTYLFPIVVVLSALFGIMLIIPIGGADMPTVISLMNSYAGLSSVAMGFVLDNKALIIAGALDGSSGFLLSVMMCKAMNRSFTNVLFGAFGQVAAGAAGGGAIEERPVRSATAEEAAMLLETARKVIVVPGYGMAVSQAQHKIRELSDVLGRNGCEVKFAIHPVAGRMPGHMNVLLAEADVPYDQICDMDDINGEFAQTDVCLVVGANDVTNPAAKTDPASPIYGMPILDVESARTVMVIKRGMKPGFAGVENELYFQEKTLMIFGDAKGVAEGLVRELEATVPA